MADKRKRTLDDEESNEQPSIKRETVENVVVKPEPVVEHITIDDSDEEEVVNTRTSRVIEGTHEINPLYLKEEARSPQSTVIEGFSDEEDPVNHVPLDQLGGGRFRVTERHAAHDNYLSTIVLVPAREATKVV
jgi:hypothetical protein